MLPQPSIRSTPLITENLIQEELEQIYDSRPNVEKEVRAELSVTVLSAFVQGANVSHRVSHAIEIRKGVLTIFVIKIYT